MIVCDINFHNSSDICVKELYEEALIWAYDSSEQMPITKLASGVEKARVTLDMPSLMKSFWLRILSVTNSIFFSN